MSKDSRRSMRAALMMSAAMLVAAPGLAQDAPATAPQIAPPPVTATVAAPTPSVAPPPVAQTVPSASPAATGESPTRVNPEAAAQAAAEDAERRNAVPTERQSAPRAAARTVSAAAPVAATAPAAAPAPAAPSQAPAAPVAAAPVGQPTAQAPAAAEEQSNTTTEQGPALWPLGLIALLILGAGAAWFLMRRRRGEAEYDGGYVEEPAYAEPVAVAHSAGRAAPSVAAAAAAGLMIDDRAPERDRRDVTRAPDAPRDTVIVADAAPVAAEDATLVAADSGDVAALAAADAPADRPWLEFAMRPVRAGANVDEALVEIELTVANAGTLPAEDVRISTFMLPAGNDSEMERLLIERSDEAVSPITIPAGEGTRLDATLATSRAALVNGAEHAAFQPVIVADVRYRLPDGSEGRTSASFLVGTSAAEGGALEPLSLDRPDLREDVEARLYREPARV